MTITIELPTQTERKLRLQAERKGQDLDTLVRSILEYSVRPLAETAAPLHEAFRQSGMTQDQLDDFTDELVREVRAEKQLRNG